MATAKHFAVHSGPEADRHRFDARVSAHDLRDSYLPQFEACVREGQVAAVMPAYNRVDGEPCAASPRLLETILRREWGFGGFVVSDCGAIDDIYRAHKVASSKEEAAAMALQAGTDLNCGSTYRALVDAVKHGRVTEAEIDRAVGRLFAARFALGMFDPPAMVPWAQIPIDVVDSPAHRALAKVAAQKSIVLLENRGGVLPLAPGPALRAIAVVGPTADDEDVLLGNYNGKPSRAVTILAGVRAQAQARGVEVRYSKGCGIASQSASRIADAVDSGPPPRGRRRGCCAGAVAEIRRRGERQQPQPERRSARPVAAGRAAAVAGGGGRGRQADSSGVSPAEARLASTGPSATCRRCWWPGTPARRGAPPWPTCCSAR